MASLNLTSDQIKKFRHYQALDLDHKIYQLKALKLAQKHLSNKKKPKILDLGCADGSFANLAAQKLSAESFGLDITPQAIKKAQKKLDHAKVHNLNLPFPYQPNTFDLIFALEVIEHLFDTDQFLKNIHKILKPQGILILSTPNLASIKNRLKLLLNHYPQYLEYSAQGAGHIHLYTSSILINQLHRHHLKTRQVTSPNFPFPVTKTWLPKPIKHLFIRLGDFFPTIGSHLIILAQK